MSDSLKESIVHWFTIALIAIVILGGAAMAYPSYSNGQKLKLQEAELKAKIEEKKAEIAKLQECQRRFRTDPEFVETIARQNRRVFPGELVFIFED